MGELIMKISIISDSHLGHKWGTELQEDSFEQFEEALQKSIEAKVDLILLPGDIFDTRTPKQEVWARSLKSFQKHLLADKNGIQLDSFIGEPKQLSKMVLQGIPIIAIHGTHERRGEHLINPVQLLEEAGYLIHLDKNGVIFSNKGKVAIQGLSGVPEEDVKKTLEDWNPKPIENCFNLFVFHQSTKEEIYDRDNTFLSIDDMPPGFDLYIDGHIHWRNYIPEKKFLIPGSTVITQQKEKEAQQGKGFFILDTNPFKLDFVKLGSQRPFYFKTIESQNSNQLYINEQIRNYLQSIPKTDKKPRIKIKLKGKMEQGKKASQLNFAEFKTREDMIISIDNEIESEDFKKAIQELRNMHQNKKSVDEMGMDLIKQLLAKTDYSGINVNEIIEPLADGDIDFVLKKIESQS